jgi:type IV secretory pathway VirB2 component (pilin)
VPVSTAAISRSMPQFPLCGWKASVTPSVYNTIASPVSSTIVVLFICKIGLCHPFGCAQGRL